MKKNTLRRQGTEWSNDEVKTLRQLFRNNSNGEVAVVLERTSKSVERKAAKLGLRKTKKYMKTLGRIG